MARVYPLFSSSEGNATYIGDQRRGILIDAGVSCKRLVASLEANGIPMSAVQAIFITHEHSDHVKGLKTLTSRYAVDVFAQPLTAEYLAASGQISPRSRLYDITGETEASGFLAKPFATQHDTRQSCGYKLLTPDGRCICICTDLGKVTESVFENLSQAQLVLLEANYDYNMLKNGPYPYVLKQRILSEHGHLSNDECGAVLKRLAAIKTTRFIIGHLSRHNNNPQVAERTVLSELSGFERNRDFLLLTAPPEAHGEVMII